MPLGKIETIKKSGKEKFMLNEHELGFDLNAFWGWSSSELLSNTLRGVLAEYIVSQDIGCIVQVREEWDAYDLLTPEGIKIEIKSSAYLQSWEQKKLSKIIFGIQPTFGWDASTNAYSSEQKRQSDVYVFCVFSHKEKTTANPQNLNQWDFYVLSTARLNQVLPNQKTIGLSRLLKLNPTKVSYGKIHQKHFRHPL